MRRARAVALAAATLLVGAPVALLAQTVETVGTSDVALDRRLASLLDADPLIIAADRRIGRADTIRGSVLVLDATLILEGTITGDLVFVDAGVFVRHGAAVQGDLVNIGGGLYRSELSKVGGTIIDLPDASYRVLRERDRLVIEASATPVAFTPDGLFGIRAPTYDRANGLTVAWGARYRLPRLGDVTPGIRGRIGWRTEAGAPEYGASFALSGSGVRLETGLDRTWATNEAWISSDIRNSVNYLWDGDDFRNYYGASRRWATLQREVGDAAKSFFAVFRLTGQVEDATSLGAGAPWRVLGGPVRPNPAVDDGRITSLIGDVEVEWRGLETDLGARVAYETGLAWRGGEHAFGRLHGHVAFGMHALFDHTLEIEAFGQLPVGGDTLPRQRWSVVGGPGTLQTLAVAERAGDHVLMVETRYRVPLPDFLALPFVGPPEAQLVHAAGMAWLADDDGGMVQELGLGVRFRESLYFRYMIQPTATDRRALVVGLTWPFGRSYPWETR